MKLLDEIRACLICQGDLPLEPRPILQFTRQSKILIMGQAPGIKAHDTLRPWNDASGERLRLWLKMKQEFFYDANKTAIVPIGFCYPGRGKSGDLPPRPECRVRWMDTILCELKDLELTILVGAYATTYMLGAGDFNEQIQAHAQKGSPYIVLPHPSPRNNIWLAKNPWFEKETLPQIRRKLKPLLSDR